MQPDGSWYGRNAVYAHTHAGRTHKKQAFIFKDPDNIDFVQSRIMLNYPEIDCTSRAYFKMLKSVFKPSSGRVQLMPR